MEKQKRWQFILIIAVILLTVYNILPTIFYYSKPLKEEIGEARAQHSANSIARRVNSLQNESRDWLFAFCKLVKVQAKSIKANADFPEWFELSFSNSNDAAKFKAMLPQAGSLIPFVPSHLSLGPQVNPDPNVVTVERQIGYRFNSEDLSSLFQFTSKYTDEQKVAPNYRTVTNDRIEEIILSLSGTSKTAQEAMILLDNANSKGNEERTLSLAQEIVRVQSTFGNNPATAKRFYTHFFQGAADDTAAFANRVSAKFESVKSLLNTKKSSLLQAADQNKNTFTGINQEQINTLDKQIALLSEASSILAKNSSAFAASPKSVTRSAISGALKQSSQAVEQSIVAEKVDISGTNPLFQSIVIDWSSDKVTLKLYNDLDALRSKKTLSESEVYKKEQVEQVIINEIATLSRENNEVIFPEDENFSFRLNTLTNSRSLLVFDLGELGIAKAKRLKGMLQSSWQAKHTDLRSQNYPVLDYETFKTLPVQEQKLGLVVYAPKANEESTPKGFRPGSLYIIARNLIPIQKKYQDYPEAEETQTLYGDIQELSQILQKQGFIGYSGNDFGISSAFKNDIIFELSDYYSTLLGATRENFSVHGSKRYAILEFTDVEQRIITENAIDDAIHDDLLKWKESYQKSQVSLDQRTFYSIPKPTKNAYWENMKLTAVKYFRGDNRNILRWGLDLSGGKSVRIGLRDKNNQVVTEPEDLNQAVNELYSRIDNMGVSEKNIRIENNNIILEFPGSQGLSATELITASSMTFQIVNEKFSIDSQELGNAVNTFLQEVWNEAVVTNRKDVENINTIAWEHLGGDENSLRPKSPSAQILVDNGLVFMSPNDNKRTNAFDDTISAIARFRGDEYTEWQKQSHPLLVTFNNYALEGSSLSNVQVGYTSNEGNYLHFSVRSSYEKQTGDPRNDFQRWTSEFSRDRIVGTLREQYAPKDSQGRISGYRMAIILNNEVISNPVLSAALRDGGQISGNFTQRQINTLASDLKAGSLSFTPRILSEYNISPELGKEERSSGINSACVGFGLVILLMVGYYRFAGIVASFAVIFNLLMMWGILQNLDAALSLPGIAAIVLTVGMAVDANVLVFERTREEFKISGRLGSALQAGYKKAFSAIIDSNLTTVIAALILIQFDSGPIKGFATTLIIGIASSMFSALFMTRFFFAGWIKTTKAKSLTMMEFIEGTKINFLKYTKPVIVASVIFIVIGGYFLVNQRSTILGMDFTGGYSLIANVEETANTDYRSQAKSALVKAGLKLNDFQVQELSRPNQLRIQLGVVMEELGKPFYGMSDSDSKAIVKYGFESNPRLVWVVGALKAGDLNIQEWQLESLDNSWSVMSGQLSDAMRNNALIALSCALLAILAYITLRFEFKYAAAAVIGLTHDVLITLGALGILHKMGLPIQIDLTVIGAVMTIIGYSLNDTIIIFDRIREDIRLMRKKPFPEIINHALNVTLSRTLMTSGTTLLVLFSLVLFGGHSIFTFALTMTLGVFVGTLSSLLVSAPVMLYIHNLQQKTESKSLKLKHS
jgi:SecD/SecF fusion protein